MPPACPPSPEGVETNSTGTIAARRSEFGTIYRGPKRRGFYLDFVWRGRRVKRAAGSTWAAADRKRREVRVLLEREVPLEEVLSSVFGDFHGARLSVRDAGPVYLAAAATRKRPSTLAVDARRLRTMCEAPWAGKRLGEVETKDLLPWIAERQKSRTVKRKRPRRSVESAKDYRKAPDRLVEVKVKGAAGPTMNRYLALGSALYRWAIRAGYVTENPFRNAERFSERGRGRETYLSAEECRALLDCCSPILRPVVLAALHTGMRKGELLGLRWRSVDLDRREIRIEADTEKANRGRVVPMTATMHEMLVALKSVRKRPALNGSDTAFTLTDGKALDDGAIRRMFDPTVAKCEGIPLAKRDSVTFHALRHTAASLMVAASVPIFDVAKILGHSTLAVTMRYAHFAPQAGRAAIDRLGSALDGARYPTGGEAAGAQEAR